jgi:threonylcarbamoyladenosine tRNA methylthiotransferase MtaB
MKKVAIHTLGCKLNFAESSTIGRQFLQNGYEICPTDEQADIHIVNTCSVSHRADRECRQLIRHLSRTSPGALISVVGCYAQLRPEEVASIPGVDLVLGAKEKFSTFDFLKQVESKGTPKIIVSDVKEIDDFGIAYSGDADCRTRSFLKVQDGCDFKCSFCTIPLARGSSRSLSPETIINQAQIIADKGFKEIVLSGVNVGDYGKKIGTNLLALLKSLVRVEGIERIRVSSIEPNLLSESLIDFILENNKMCNHFHIPLQSGSNKILRAMSRRYSTDDYRRVVDCIKVRDKSAGIGMDVIVGFPGETDNDFEDTYKFIEDLAVSYLHVFTYSERPSTPAIAFSGRVEPARRRDRNEKLHLLGSEKKNYFYSGFIGKSLPVLFETQDENDYTGGFTTNYIRVKTHIKQWVTNKIVPTYIKTVSGDYCEGVVNGHSLRIETKEYCTTNI